MAIVKIHEKTSEASTFIEDKYNETGDPHFYRNPISKEFRNLSSQEISILKSNNNYAENWDNIFVTDKFIPSLIRQSHFYGKITIDDMQDVVLEHNELKLATGIYESTIVSCNIGKDTTIRNVKYLAHYTIGDNCILFNVDEFLTTSNAKFGNGIIKEGESEKDRVWLEVANENSGRSILPFIDMIPADAFLWAKYRDDKLLLDKFLEITDKQYDSRRGYYGSIGTNSVIKHTRIIKNTNIGEHAYIKGANKLKNITVLSSREEPSQIGEGVELVNGIMGYGCNVFYGAIGVRFILGRKCQLKYGARLINSVLGDNSTVSCCELLNNLIFPFHEQHHNSSFLISSIINGQSNIAAGATIGSNHNSRANDGEIVAGRGFWPGLCTSFKHNSKFASYVLIAKGSYKCEMNIKYPFSLVFKNNGKTTIMPAYWLMYNMYAMARNGYKFQNRDKRKIKIQNIETDFLAPDSITDTLEAIDIIYHNLGKNKFTEKNLKKSEIITKAQKYFTNFDDKDITFIDNEAIRKSKTIVVKPLAALKAYTDICKLFFIKTILSYNIDNFSCFKEKILDIYSKKLYTNWKNMGGQLIPEEKLNELKDLIKNDKLTSWNDIHKQYDKYYSEYIEDKSRFALYTIEKIINKKIPNFSDLDFKNIIKDTKNICKDLYTRAYSSKEKDYTDEFRKITFDNIEEMNQVVGKIEENDFLISLKDESDKFCAQINKLLL